MNRTQTTQTRRSNVEHNAAVAGLAQQRTLADVHQELSAARLGLTELQNRIMDLEEEGMQMLTGRKKPGRKRHRSGHYAAVGTS